MSNAAASRRKTIPMNSAMYESVWVSEIPDRSCRATMTVKMLNHKIPTTSPPIASAAIVLRRGASVRINSVTEVPPHVLVVILEVTARGLDDEVADDRPEKSRGDADDPDPVGPDEDPFLGCRGRQSGQEDLADHPDAAVWDAIPADALARGLRREGRPVEGDVRQAVDVKFDAHVFSRVDVPRADFAERIGIVDREGVDHPAADRVIVDERDVQRDVYLRDNQRRREEVCGPSLVDPDRIIQLRTLGNLRARGPRRGDGNRRWHRENRNQNGGHEEHEVPHLRILLLPIPSRDFRAIAKKSVPYLYVVHESIFTP